jgi:hypothetical protein
VASSARYGELSFATFGYLEFPTTSRRPILRFMAENRLLGGGGRPPPADGPISARPYQTVAALLLEQGWPALPGKPDARQEGSDEIRQAQRQLGLEQTGTANLALLAALIGAR